MSVLNKLLAVLEVSQESTDRWIATTLKHGGNADACIDIQARRQNLIERIKAN